MTAIEETSGSAIKRIRNEFRDLDPDFAEIENYTACGYRWGKPTGADSNNPNTHSVHGLIRPWIA